MAKIKKWIISLPLKPLSINEAWQGRRYKTKKYKKYERDALFLLPLSMPIVGKLDIQITYGFSTKNADIDNPTKPILDILQKKYKFNDNQIYRLTLEKKIVYKGFEFTEIEISRHE